MHLKKTPPRRFGRALTHLQHAGRSKTDENAAVRRQAPYGGAGKTFQLTEGISSKFQVASSKLEGGFLTLNLQLGTLNLPVHPLSASATSTARRGAMTPQPWRSISTSGRRSAVSMSMRLTCCGVRCGLASSMQATVEETMGAANEVPSTNL